MLPLLFKWQYILEYMGSELIFGLPPIYA